MIPNKKINHLVILYPITILSRLGICACGFRILMEKTVVELCLGKCYAVESAINIWGDIQQQNDRNCRINSRKLVILALKTFLSCLRKNMFDIKMFPRCLNLKQGEESNRSEERKGLRWKIVAKCDHLCINSFFNFFPRLKIRWRHESLLFMGGVGRFG